MKENTALHEMTNVFEASLRRALQALSLPSEDTEIQFEHPADSNHGDWSTNVALQLFGQYKEQLAEIRSPRQLAEEIVRKLDDVSEFAKVDVAGPGFINFTIQPEVFVRYLRSLIHTSVADQLAQKGKGKTAVVEYSSPNIAKPFTIGHLRSTIIGDAVANLLEATGWTVQRDNHLGDWGTQFGKQICAIKKWGNEDEIANAERPVKKLVELYVKFHEEAEKDPSLVDEGRAWFKKLEDGDAEARRLWQKCIDWSWVEFNKIYAELGVTFTENDGRGYGESYFEDKMTPVVEELQEKGLLTDSEGAKLVFFPDEKYPPMMIIKQDGTTLYATRDLATDRFRLQKYGEDVRIINEVGAEQSLYFQQLFAIEEMLGWIQPGQRVHVKHGMFRFQDGKMSTRKGNVIWLEDVLAEARQRATELGGDLSSSSEVASAVGIGALKWNDLKRSAHLDVVFDWSEMLSMEGNSGPYMQYAAVRCKSVLEKWSASGEVASDVSESEISPEELNLLRLLARYSEAVERAADEYAPHHVANALFEIAQAFNTFYNKHQIVQANTPQIRLDIVKATLLVLEHGLSLLGIKTVERM